MKCSQLQASYRMCCSMQSRLAHGKKRMVQRLTSGDGWTKGFPVPTAHLSQGLSVPYGHQECGTTASRILKPLLCPMVSIIILRAKMHNLPSFLEIIRGSHWGRARSSTSVQARVGENTSKHNLAIAGAACIGGVSLTLAQRFPDLHFIVQDRPFVIQQAEEVWAREVPGALASGRLRLMTHNFFEEQPVKSADVYVMRLIL